MDHRTRVLTAINHEEPDYVPTALWGSAYGITDELYFKLLDVLELGSPVLPMTKVESTLPRQNTPCKKQRLKIWILTPFRLSGSICVWTNLANARSSSKNRLSLRWLAARLIHTVHSNVAAPCGKQRTF